MLELIKRKSKIGCIYFDVNNILKQVSPQPQEEEYPFVDEETPQPQQQQVVAEPPPPPAPPKIYTPMQ